jgi:hypothetical protein
VFLAFPYLLLFGLAAGSFRVGVDQLFEDVEAAVPESAVLFSPLGNFPQGLQAGGAMTLPTLPDDYDQPAFGEDAHVLRHSGLADPKVLCDGIKREGPTGQEADHRPAGRVGNGLEYVSSGLHWRMF